jgi:membrane fusion protein (multidrug efflux system)
VDSSQLSSNTKQLEEHQITVLEPDVVPNSPGGKLVYVPYRKLPRKLLLGVGTIMVALIGLSWWQYLSSYEESSQALIAGNVYPVNTSISGTVVEVAAKDNQVVSPNTVLVKLDRSIYQKNLHQGQAALSLALQQAEVARANIAITAADKAFKKAQFGVSFFLERVNDAQTGIQTAQKDEIQAQEEWRVASLSLEEANVGIKTAQANLLTVRRNQQEQIHGQGKITIQQLDIISAAQKAKQSVLQAQKLLTPAKKRVQQASSKLTHAKRNVSKAQAKLAPTQQGLTKAQTKLAIAQEKLTKASSTLAIAQQGLTKASSTLPIPPDDVKLAPLGNEQEYQAAKAAIAQATTKIKNAQFQLSHAKIKATSSGQIGNRAVRVGQRVQPGQTLISIVGQNIWIVANFEKSQLTKMKPGQKVEIKINTFPDRTFQGKLASLSQKGTKLAQIAPDNTEGHLSEIVQRVPVKILFDTKSLKGYESRIIPGMSAVVSVQTR